LKLLISSKYFLFAVILLFKPSFEHFLSFFILETPLINNFLVLLNLLLSFFVNLLLVSLSVSRVKGVAVHRIDRLPLGLIILKMTSQDTWHEMGVVELVMGGGHEVIVHGWVFIRLSQRLSVTIHVYFRDCIRSSTRWSVRATVLTLSLILLLNHGFRFYLIIHADRTCLTLLLSYRWKLNCIRYTLRGFLLLVKLWLLSLLWLYSHHRYHLLHHLFLR